MGQDFWWWPECRHGSWFQCIPVGRPGWADSEKNSFYLPLFPKWRNLGWKKQTCLPDMSPGSGQMCIHEGEAGKQQTGASPVTGRALFPNPKLREESPNCPSSPKLNPGDSNWRKHWFETFIIYYYQIRHTPFLLHSSLIPSHSFPPLPH